MGPAPDTERPWAEHVLAARAGDREAFAALVERFRGPVFAIAYSYLRDPHEAEDIAQETFARAFLALPRLDEPARFASWLNGIAAHAAVDRLRERQLAAKVASDPWKAARLARGANPEDTASRKETIERLAEALEEALGELPEDSRRAVLLRFFSGMSYAEIAELTSVPTSTVRGQLYRATRHLRERLRPFWEGPGRGV